ncbi:response regulator [Lutispora sp.]|uniref:GGDEF domain-containing response regulator n=1 Tax=Lutispora sp. TaxID=2828727 RepID=UPI0035630465
MFKKKILVIDDTELTVSIITEMLTEEGYEVVVARNGLEGLQKVREEKPDLVILDVVMPGMDGFEVCKVLRDDESNNLMPIVMLTAQDNEEDKLMGLELGVDDYIFKPFNHRELVSRVKNTLRRIDRNRWANPLTGLQGNIEIHAEINKRIAREEQFAVLYLDLDNFKAYNDVYGFSSGDRAIKLTADIILSNVQMIGNDGDFIGHIGGDDFVVITIPEKAAEISEGIIQDFDSKMVELYSDEDREKGYITTMNRLGQTMEFPIMTISIAVVTNEARVLYSPVQIAEIAAEVKKKAKMLEGSVYIKDKRKYR